MVASKEEEVLWILDFVSKQKADGLQGLLATVDVVTKERIAGVGREAAILEKPEQIIVLIFLGGN